MKKYLTFLPAFLFTLLIIAIAPTRSQSVTSVTLTWNADPATSTNEAAASYNVYHSATVNGTFLRVNPTPITALTFVDTVNKTGFWEVTGVGADGQEGAKSAGVTFAVNPPAVPTGLKVAIIIVN